MLFIKKLKEFLYKYKNTNTNTIPRSINNKIISKKDREFVILFMYWCSRSIFKHECADWYLDRNLDPKVWYLHHTYSRPREFSIRTVHQNRRLKYSETERSILHKRLCKNALTMITGQHNNGTWSCNKLNLIALCITVAEVTEEISFIFSTNESIAMKVLKQCIFYAWNDKGFLYSLASL